MPTTSTPWSAFATAEPALAQAVEARFAANLHHVLGTLASDGRPRLSGLEAPVRDGHLWLGMMPASVKCADLRRDARFALHAAPLEDDLASGDAKVDARAVEVTDEEPEWQRFLDGMAAHGDGDGETGGDGSGEGAAEAGTADTSPAETSTAEPPPGGMALFVADLDRVTLTRVVGDALQVTTWTPDAGIVTHEVR